MSEYGKDNLGNEMIYDSKLPCEICKNEYVSICINVLDTANIYKYNSYSDFFYCPSCGRLINRNNELRFNKESEENT